MPPEKQMILKKQAKIYGNLPKSKRAHNVLNLSDKVKI
jgi:hypothetical protein